MNRSIMFVPANAPDKFRKAQDGAADALILDLEDSVPRQSKDAARQAVPQLLAAASRRQQLWVRVNDVGSGLLLADLAAVVPAQPFGIVLPKCQGVQTLDLVCHYLDAFEASHGITLGQTKILAIVTETAQSLFHLGEYHDRSGRLWGLTWGAEDLGADVGAVSNKSGSQYTEPFRLARSLCLFAAAAAGVRAIDAVCVSLSDQSLVRTEAQEAFRDGFVGKMAIHPAQLGPINEAFTYSAAQVAWAQQVVAAFAEQPGRGALQVDGKMIDEPHLKMARRILAL